MVTRTATIKISGPAMSLLLYENINVIHEQEGFLLGNITKRVTKSMTDSLFPEVKIQEIIQIYGVLTCDLPHMFYSSDGELLIDELNDILGSEKKNVIAWFRYKKNRKYDFRFTIREQILHEELTNFFGIPPHLFTCCVLNSLMREKSTHAYPHTFVSINNGQFRVIPMQVENLGAKYHVYQHNKKPSEAFKSLFKNINQKQSNIHIGTDIHNVLVSEIKKSITNLSPLAQDVAAEIERVHDIKMMNRLATLIPDRTVEIKVENKRKEIIVETLIAVTTDPIKRRTIHGQDGDVNQIVEGGLELGQIEQLKVDDFLDEKTAVVDLTLSDEEEPTPKQKRAPRSKTAKAKKAVRNT